MPIGSSFADRLLPVLPSIVEGYKTPFHIYDIAGIKATHQNMVSCFSQYEFKQYFAVKSLPNPLIIKHLVDLGSGMDCSSPVELIMAKSLGVSGESIVFTSNNTSNDEYQMALDAGALVTFDDYSIFHRAKHLPEAVSFRVSPASFVATSELMTGTQGSKFGVPKDELLKVYGEAKNRGVKRFGIHGMSCANELNVENAISFAEELVSIAKWIQEEIEIQFDYINFGGGMGIPYYTKDKPFDFEAYAKKIEELLFQSFSNKPKIVMECGRYVTGPHGLLVTSVINRMQKERDIVGVNASMSDLMRPGFYKTAYHHITLPFVNDDERSKKVVDVVGPLCENMDRFAIDREIIDPKIGDILIIHDTGAHSHAMGFNYNGRLRPAELMLDEEDQVIEIRRAETYDDYVSTIQWEPKQVLTVNKQEKI